MVALLAHPLEVEAVAVVAEAFLVHPLAVAEEEVVAEAFLAHPLEVVEVAVAVAAAFQVLPLVEAVAEEVVAEEQRLRHHLMP